MKKLKLISIALFSLITMSTARQSIVSAEGTSTKAVVEESGDKKVAIDDKVKNEAEKATVVQGADGLMYVVVDENDPEKLLEAESPLKNQQENTGAVEVGVDEKRQEKADKANEKVKNFDDIDYNDISSLQSALNDPKFPFLSEDELNENCKRQRIHLSLKR